MSQHPTIRRTIPLIAAASLAACSGTSGPVQSEPSPAVYAERGLQAAKTFPGYASLCDLDMAFRDVNVLKSDPVVPQTSERSRAAGSRTERDRSFPATQVFDNLYFVGNQSVSAWLLGTAEGYVLIDAMTSDNDAKESIDAGIVSLGLDPTAIRYLLITHAHGDHFGGYQYIEDKYDPEIVMSHADWALAEMLREHPRFGSPPPRDVVVRDGDQLEVGSTTLDIHVTVGHTPGTISPIFTVYDDGKPYRAILWGGTGFNFGPSLQRMRAYAASAERLRDIASDENVQVFLSNHGRRDGSIDRMRALAGRGPGDPHPFVQGTEILEVFSVLEQCAMAQAERIRAAGIDSGKP